MLLTNWRTTYWTQTRNSKRLISIISNLGLIPENSPFWVCTNVSVMFLHANVTDLWLQPGSWSNHPVLSSCDFSFLHGLRELRCTSPASQEDISAGRKDLHYCAECRWRRPENEQSKGRVMELLCNLQATAKSFLSFPQWLSEYIQQEKGVLSMTIFRLFAINN